LCPNARAAPPVASIAADRLLYQPTLQVGHRLQEAVNCGRQGCHVVVGQHAFRRFRAVHGRGQAPARESLKNSIPGIFQLAAARYTPARRCLNQWLTPLIQVGASCPRREALNKSALP
jgi:predicted NBD/HSP70 family sugar kinase